MKPAALPWNKRALLACTQRWCSPRRGHLPAVTRQMAEAMSCLEFLKWTRAVTEVTERLIHHFGEYRAQSLLGLAGLWNGCAYGGCCHLYAANLTYFRDTGCLPPLDHVELHRLFDLPDPHIVEYLDRTLSSKGDGNLRAVALRQCELYLGSARRACIEDALLQASLDTFDWLVEYSILVSIDVESALIVPSNELGYDDDLVARFHAARADAGRP